MKRSYNFIHPVGDRPGRRNGRPRNGTSCAEQDGPQIFIERARRQSALYARDLTGSLFNDPPPGYSALDVKAKTIR